MGNIISTFYDDEVLKTLSFSELNKDILPADDIDTELAGLSLAPSEIPPILERKLSLNLPPKVWEQILEKLDRKDILNLTLTVNIFNRLIGSSEVFQRRMAIRWNTGRDLKVLLANGRTYKSIKLIGAMETYCLSEFSVVIDKLRETLEKIELSDQLIKISPMLQILSTLSNLTSLSLINVKLEKKFELNPELSTKLENLTELKLMGSQTKLLGHFMNLKLKTFKIAFNPATDNNAAKQYDDTIDFLISQTSLIHLCLIEGSARNMFKKDILKCTFQLEFCEISLHDFTNSTESTDPELLVMYHFLMAQKITKLDMVFRDLFTYGRYMRFILMMPLLTEVTLHHYGEIYDDIYEMKYNYSVKHITLITSMELRSEEEALLSHLRKLESIELRPYKLNFDLLTVLHGLPHLKKIKWNQFKMQDMLRLPRVQEMIFDNDYDTEDMNWFIECNVHLKKMVIIIRNGIVFVESWKYTMRKMKALDFLDVSQCDGFAEKILEIILMLNLKTIAVPKKMTNTNVINALKEKMMVLFD